MERLAVTRLFLLSLLNRAVGEAARPMRVTDPSPKRRRPKADVTGQSPLAGEASRPRPAFIFQSSDFERFPNAL